MSKHTQTSSIVPLEISSHRFKALDALRGLAAWSVVLYHFLLVLPPSMLYTVVGSTPLHLLTNGPEAVILFFLLSGFVLASLWSRNTSGYVGYGVKRVTRLCLPFYAALLLAALLDLYFLHPLHVSNEWINSTWTIRPTWPMAFSVIMTADHWMQQFNTAFWSVGYEVRISLLFPLLYWLVLRVRSILGVPILLLSQLALPFAHPFDRYIDSGFQAAVIEFALGILLFRELPRLLLVVNRVPPARRKLLALVFILLYAVAVPAPQLDVVQRSGPQENVPAITTANTTTKQKLSFKTKLRRALVTEARLLRIQCGMVAAVGVMLMAIALPSLRAALQQGWLLRIGALSYSTYLLHGTVLFALIRAFYGRFSFAYLVLPYLVLVYLASEVFHKLIDQPAVLLSRKVEARLLKKATYIEKGQPAGWPL